MNYVISGYNPPSLFRYFEEISAIPRESGNEKGVCDYLRDFSQKNNLEFYSDKFNNCFIKKNASPGCENRQPLLLQAHTDMVCEKNEGCTHNFSSDVLQLYIENSFLFAKGTTLGADNGIGVAAILALLSDNSLVHPPLECLFTADEEVGMRGAINFDYSKISAKRLINLDSGRENEATAGCAGGIQTKMTYRFDMVKNDNKIMKISLKGLCGGHSGADINLGRGSAVNLMTRMLASLYDKLPFNLISFSSGTKTTAIAREATAFISVINFEESKSFILEFEKIIAGEISEDDKNFVVHISKSAFVPECMTYRDSRRLLSLLAIIPTGVKNMSSCLPGIVETSANIGIVSTESHSISIESAIRSSKHSRLEESVFTQKIIAKEFDCEFVSEGEYPAWPYSQNSEMQKAFISSYEFLYSDRAPYITVTHAGLECGTFAYKIPCLDAISIGPDMFDIHTPSERLSLLSCERFYSLLVKMIADI